METQFKLIEKAQQNFIKLLEGLSMEQLNKIPNGFKNNLIWNYAHIISALQLLCYGRNGLPLRLDQAFVHTFKVGTKPEAFINEDEYRRFQEYAEIGINTLREDYLNNYFSNFSGYITSTGFEINSIEAAISFVLHHHGIHTGYAMAMKKSVVQ